ncbi:hypothetical protein BpOF4_09040 [Alkalihalophilus pseudofirmus OF4]|uniref:Uncharacterized protein n=1 Tax=Alkalihalophilus pseudofirmus (strain ATCC BAA-2126 / JCM 17055 / OF4) TaxID=398511 RepID=D3FRV4_ALKPO|nr:hypothetical protein [Alkalihalophilus pseudofirmus]ADC49864.1 hypothetical protein BpOF4_09040 [Alkalihalophilus pseudofirmus OF4]
MSDYQEYLAERDEIDYLIQQGYVIKGVTENLSGAFVEFELPAQSMSRGQQQYERLHIKTADARKYFSVLLLKQAQKTG